MYKKNMNNRMDPSIGSITDLAAFQKALGLRGVAGHVIGKHIAAKLKIDQFDYLRRQNNHPDGYALALWALKEIGVSYHLPEQQLNHIPRKGGCIFVSNHHYGAVDGLILEAVVGYVRPDMKIMTNFYLASIPGLSDSFIAVDSFSKGTSRSVSGFRSAIEHLNAGYALGVFPAGEVATWQTRKNRTSIYGKHIVEDKPWVSSIVKLIKKSGLPIVPVYFKGGNSRLFHLLGRIHPRLRTFRLLREIFNKRGSVIEIRIGQPIMISEINAMDVPMLGKYIRNRCYALEAQCITQKGSSQHPESMPLEEPVPDELIREEMRNLGEKILFELGNYRIYMLRSGDAPNAMRELYRLREEAFRGVGEGTGRSLDTDIYDSRYYHLILWNVPDGRIAGAYRIADCQKMIKTYGYQSILLSLVLHGIFMRVFV